MMRLTEHRSYPAHLKHEPFDRLDPCNRIARHHLAGLFGEIDQNGAGFENLERPAAGSIAIDDRRNLGIRIDGDVVGLELIALADMDRMNVIRQPYLLEHDGDLFAVRRAP